jgi:hypothetical protein
MEQAAEKEKSTQRREFNSAFLGFISPVFQAFEAKVTKKTFEINFPHMLTDDLEVEQSSEKVFAMKSFRCRREKSLVIALSLQVFMCSFNHATT